MLGVLSVIIFVSTLVLVLWRPRNINAGLVALGGGLIAWATGVVNTADVVRVIGMTWNATLALIGLMIVSLLLDRAGFFKWAALHLARRAGGTGLGLFLAVTLLSSGVAAILTNDSAVLILTPIVFELLQVLGFRRADMLPFLFATAFVADTVSLPLPVSNLTNIIAADHFGLTAGPYIAKMLLPSLVSLVTSVGMLVWVYRRQLPRTYQPDAVPTSVRTIADPPLFYVGAAVVTLLMVAIGLNTFWHLPISLLMGTGAVVMLLATRVTRVVAPGEVLKRAPWHVVIFSLGMYLVVYGLRHAGATDALGGMLSWAAQHGRLAAVLVSGGLVSLLSAGMNNLPGLLLGILGIDAAGVNAQMSHLLTLAAVIGSDIGPKMTPIGSLATLMWLHYLQYKGVAVSWRYILRLGLILTPPVLLATLLALWLVS